MRTARRAATAVLLAMLTAFGAHSDPARNAATAPPNPFTLLDGRSFQGEIRDEKGVVRAQDMLSFRNGQLRSDKCREMGFADSPYWVRIIGDEVHFLTESANPETGRIVLQGVVRGGRAEWKGVWSKDRWYWSIRRDISFAGMEKK